MQVNRIQLEVDGTTTNPNVTGLRIFKEIKDGSDEAVEDINLVNVNYHQNYEFLCIAGAWSGIIQC